MKTVLITGGARGIGRATAIRLLADGYSVAFTYSSSGDAAAELTNLHGAFSMTRAVLAPMMKQRRGAIVNVTSISGMHGVVGQTNYSAAKGGLIAMTTSLAREVARSGIRGNCVAPRLVETDMIAGLDPEAKRDMI